MEAKTIKKDYKQTALRVTETMQQHLSAIRKKNPQLISDQSIIEFALQRTYETTDPDFLRDRLNQLQYEQSQLQKLLTTS